MERETLARIHHVFLCFLITNLIKQKDFLVQRAAQGAGKTGHGHWSRGTTAARQQQRWIKKIIPPSLQQTKKRKMNAPQIQHTVEKEKKKYLFNSIFLFCWWINARRDLSLSLLCLPLNKFSHLSESLRPNVWFPTDTRESRTTDNTQQQQPLTSAREPCLSSS